MSNPIIKRTDLAVSHTPMSINGVIGKTTFLLGLSGLSALGLFFYTLSSHLSANMLYVLALVSMFASMGLGLASALKPHLAKTLSVPYALLEGVLLGAVSAIAYRYFPTVPLSALSATFVTAAVMLALYATGTIKVTQKFRTIIVSAVIAIAILYAIQLLFRLFGSSLPFLFDGGWIAIGFSVFVTIIASLSLLIDFDNVDQGVTYGVDESFEWVYSMGVLSTLVWMYIEFLRLIGYLQD